LAERGLEIPLSELWQEPQGGLFRAAVGLGGCSGAFVSAAGLVLTNHHCVFQAVQRNSTPQNDYLTHGFIAHKQEEELPGHGVKVYVFVKQTDVTEKILGQIPKDADDLVRYEAIEMAQKALVKECEQVPSRRCQVSRYNDGLMFVLLENLELRDVRLAAIPPRALGEFGGEVDNWRWPRHTMDFALIRAYVGPDGQPAAHAESNVPFQPERFFPLSKQGVEEGDLVMVVGTPGRTARYRTSAEVRQDEQWFYPKRAEVFGEWTVLLETLCRQEPETCLPGASRLKTLHNTLTNARGMMEGLRRGRVVGKRMEQEKALLEWIGQDAGRRERFGNVVSDIEAFVDSQKDGRDRDFLLRYLTWGVHGLSFGRTLTKWAAQQNLPDEKREVGFQERDKDRVRAELEEAGKSYHALVDQRTLAMLLQRVGALPGQERIAGFDQALKGDYSPVAIDRFVKRLYAKTQLGETPKRLALFGVAQDKLAQSRDPLIRLAMSLGPELDAYDERFKREQGAQSRLRPPYIQAVSLWRGKTFYPDANSTPRVSFGTVTGYSPGEAEHRTPHTTLAGLVAKHQGISPFDVPAAVLEEARKQPGLPVCLLSNSDTTGGNSGSPVLDGKGRIVGLNFDRVYENIAGDYGYNEALSRNVMVDARVISWYLEAVAGAKSLLSELGI
jgi:hypothetical protein